MLEHLNKEEVKPDRIVILGGKGFVGSRTSHILNAQNLNLISLGREELDLSNDESSSQLADLLEPSDTLVFISAKAPVKNEDMLIENLIIGRNVCQAIKSKAVSHLIYISSDAVYTDSDKPLRESSPAEPASLHGVMHLAREVMLKNAFQGPLCILRPTLIFGDEDPHNGYGPNSFLRLSLKGQDIKLFGEGEERRDHVWIEDVAQIILKCILSKSVGILNIATGTLMSFKQIANDIRTQVNNDIQIMHAPRSGPMPHNGYREFDITNTNLSFPDFKYKNLGYWLQNSKLIKK